MDINKCGQGCHTPTFLDFHEFESIRKTFYRDGVVFVDKINEERLVALSESLGSIVKPRNEVAGGRGVSNIRCAPNLIGKGNTVGKGYSNQELFFHTDRSGWSEPPRLLLTALKTQAETGGESVLVDGRQLFNTIRQEKPFLYSILTDAKFSSFKSDDGSFTPRPIYDEKSGIFRFRFDDGIQMGATLVECFGEFTELIYKHAFAAKLLPGQCYIVDNTRFLHARTSFTGERELYRVLAQPHPAEAQSYILFDVDGTLCRAEALSIDAYFRCISDITGQDISNENTKVSLHGQTDMSLLRDILRFHGYDEQESKPLITRFFEAHPRYLLESMHSGLSSKPCPQVKEAIEWLAQQQDCFGRRVPIGLLTGNSQHNALLKIKDAGLRTDMFDISISAFGDRHNTRASLVQESLQKIQSKYGIPVQPSDITLVGDTPLDVQCAKETGCRVIAVSTGNYTSDVLDSYAPDFSCKTLPAASTYMLKTLRIRV